MEYPQALHSGAPLARKETAVEDKLSLSTTESGLAIESESSWASVPQICEKYVRGLLPPQLFSGDCGSLENLEEIEFSGEGTLRFREYFGGSNRPRRSLVIQ